VACDVAGGKDSAQVTKRQVSPETLVTAPLNNLRNVKSQSEAEGRFSKKASHIGQKFGYIKNVKVQSEKTVVVPKFNRSGTAVQEKCLAAVSQSSLNLRCIQCSRYILRSRIISTTAVSKTASTAARLTPAGIHWQRRLRGERERVGTIRRDPSKLFEKSENPSKVMGKVLDHETVFRVH
jgi:hypothetical protein